MSYTHPLIQHLTQPPMRRLGRPGRLASKPTLGRITRLLTLLGLGVVLLGLAPTAAHAHISLVRSAPAKSTHLTMVPRELRLTFDEAIELTFTRLRLVGSDSGEVALGELRIDSARTVFARIVGPLAAGTYTVVWQVAGADGHPVRGQYTFTIAAGATGLEAPELRGEPPGGVTPPGQLPAPGAHHESASPQGVTFDAESPAYVAIRSAQFTALLLVLGALAFHLFVLGFLRRKPHLDALMLGVISRRAAALAFWAAIALGGTAALRLFAQSYALHGSGEVLDPSLIGTMLLRTMWGWGWLLQVVGVAMAIAGFRAARRGSRAGWTAATLGAIALAVTPALSGHAIATPRLTALAVLTDSLHVIGAGGWLGSLLLLVVVGVPVALRRPVDERGAAVAELVNAFSPTALVFAGLVLATGVFAAWLHLGTVPALWQTPYGRTLLLKIGVLSIVAGTGTYNWLRVKPALGIAAGGQRIRRSATVELAAGILVVVVTAVLVATPTGLDHDSGDATADVAQTTRSAGVR